MKKASPSLVQLYTLAQEGVEQWAHRATDEDDTVISDLAMTNALGWGLDVIEELEVTVRLVETADGVMADVAFRAVVSFCGDQDTEKSYCGTTLQYKMAGAVVAGGVSDVTLERIPSKDDELDAADRADDELDEQENR